MAQLGCPVNTEVSALTGANSVQLKQLSSGLTLWSSSGFHLSVSKSTAIAKDSSPWPWLESRNILRGSTQKQAGVCKAEGQRTFAARQSSGPSKRPSSFLNTLKTVPRLGKPLQPFTYSSRTEPWAVSSRFLTRRHGRLHQAGQEQQLQEVTPCCSFVRIIFCNGPLVYLHI